MRRQHRDVFHYLRFEILFCPKLIQRRPWLFSLAAILALTTLACAFSGSQAPARLVIRTHLPTLTSTPLPTLTPTAFSTRVAAAMDAVSPEGFTVPGSPASAVALDVSITHSTTGSPAMAAPPGGGQPAQAVSFAAPSEPSLGPAPLDSTPTHPAAQPVAAAEAPPSPAAANATATLPPAPTPTAVVTETPTATVAPTETPAPTPLPEGWVFSGVRLSPDQEQGGLVLYGQVINNTGVAQEIFSITGTFGEGPGQISATADDVYAYWPAYVVPAGGSMPFELMVEGLDHAAEFDLSVEAEPSSEAVQHDFEFLEPKQWAEDDLYCLEGRVKSRAGEVQDYLIVAAVLYDAQGNVVNYGDYQEFGRIGLGGDETASFDMCLGPPLAGVARYELQAWGK